ncbi:MAG TPA: SCO family protein [Ignavibacteria bacterium]|nr:SCO family protein [Ignavibacteria bacterium]
MKIINKYLITLPVLLMLLSCGEKNVSELPYYDTPDFSPLWLDDDETSGIHKVGNFSITDQDGKAVSDENFSGKIYIANFFFTTCPGICPKMTGNLKKVQSAFINDDDIKLISFSVMPWVDSVSRLKEYENSFSLKNGKWYLATGKTSDIYNLARKSFFAEEEAGFNADSTEFLHTEHVLLVDKNGHLRGVYNGTLPLEIDRMIEDVEILKKEI